MDTAGKNRLVELVKAHRRRGLLASEETELRIILAGDEPCARDMDRAGLLDLALVVIGAGILMEWIDAAWPTGSSPPSRNWGMSPSGAGRPCP